ncbi:MAG: glucokinase [Bdellovibrio sp.]
MGKKSFTIGLDLGGTKLACALLDQNGHIIDFIKIPVEMGKEGSALKTQRRVIGLMSDICHDFKRRYPTELSNKHFKGVGLASAGPLDTEKGLLISPINFPGWKTVPIKKLLQDSLSGSGIKTNVTFQNDAIAAALAEGWIGGAKSFESYAIVTVGTGIGSGVIFNGRPCHSKGMGSEFGHIICEMQSLFKNPKTLKKHTVEGIASGTALLRRAKEMGFKGESVEELVNAHKLNKNKFQILFDEMAFALAILCYDLSIGFHLDGIFISGGLIKIKQLYFDQMKKHYNTLISEFNPKFKTKISIAKTGNHAGVIGAGYLPYL